MPEGDQILEIPPAGDDEIRQVRPEAEVVLARLNEDRVGVGMRAVTPVDALTELAEAHAHSLYTQGLLQRIPDCTFSLAERSYQVTTCDNAVALASTALAALDAILADGETGSVVVEGRFDRAGVAVVDGPTGRLVLIVLGG